jgi:hypothetical protein
VLELSETVGFRLFELRLATIKHGRTWTRIQSFTYKVNAEAQQLYRIESEDTRRRTQTQTGSWDVTDAFVQIADTFKGFHVQDVSRGCSFVLVTKSKGAIFFSADSADTVRDFVQIISIASNRLKYLYIRMGKRHGDPLQEEKKKREGPKYVIGITDQKHLIELAEDPEQMRTLVTGGVLQLHKDDDKSSVWHHFSMKRISDDLALAVARQFKSASERRNVIEKLKLAGAVTGQELVRLCETPAPDGADYMPAFSFFRGRPCLLNYRIDVNGGKLFKSATLESLYRLCQMPVDVFDGHAAVEVEFKEHVTRE